ncbi:uncharacterized protein LOC124275359 isoform X2 [Haliotis rubra]|uniref:uncharacterized protein LOC124275359 isoform X2 n=1 Tax=Haliotis rubra TaxID=36100 RepID=UPI001EE549FE|nr:uncharacterized protein LOC124275359 isoform X2 [Haliotis rubra]
MSVLSTACAPEEERQMYRCYTSHVRGMALSSLDPDVVDVDTDCRDLLTDLHESPQRMAPRLRQRLEAVQARISRSVREKTDLYLDRQNTEQHIEMLDKQDEILREKVVILKAEIDRLKKTCANREQILTDAERTEGSYLEFYTTWAMAAHMTVFPVCFVIGALLNVISKRHETARSNVKDAREHLSSAARKLDDTKRVLQETQCSIESGRDSKGRYEGKVKALKEQTDGVYTDLKSLTMQETRIKKQITLC